MIGRSFVLILIPVLSQPGSFYFILFYLFIYFWRGGVALFLHYFYFFTYQYMYFDQKGR